MAGREVRPGAQLRDPQHLAARLASLRLAPEQHPYGNDSRAALALRGAASSRAARTSWKRRGVLAAWFLSVGLLPRPLATRAVLWRFIGGSRPVAVDRVLKAVRRWVR